MDVFVFFPPNTLSIHICPVHVIHTCILDHTCPHSYTRTFTHTHTIMLTYTSTCTHTCTYTHTLTFTGRRRAKQIYEEEMKRGVTKRKITKVVMVGIAGSGKTTSLETIMDEKPPAEEDRESTPLLKRPVQTEVVYIDEKVKWRKKNPEEKKQYIASLLRARAQRLGQSSPTGNHSASASTPTPATPTSVQSPPVLPASSTDQSSIAKRPTKTSATPTSAATTASEERPSSAVPAATLDSLLQSSEVDQEYISLINIPSDSSEAILTETVVYIVDSGGQPEFVEAMTVFLGETSACILIIDLSQSLDEHPTIGYYRRGKPVSKPYKCTRTNEEILKQCMTNMSTFTSKTKGPPTKLLFLGTHRDILCATETVAQKNARLLKIIPPKFTEQMIRVDCKTLIFEINALNPDDTDKKVAEKVRSYILEQCPAKEVELPVRWHALEEKLQSVCEGLGRKVMSREECWQVAESLGLDEASFDAALDFFHSMSLMFYFRDILPAVVFIDPQVMLDKVSEPIEFMFELREPEDQDECTSEATAADNHPPSGSNKQSPHSSDTATAVSTLPPKMLSSPHSSESLTTTQDGEPLAKKLPATTQALDVDLLPPGWYKFNNFGHITKPFLNDKRFSSHYHAEIFTSDDLIHLLKELLVFAKLSTDEGPDTWFMPSVLRQVPPQKIREVCVGWSPSGRLSRRWSPERNLLLANVSRPLSPKPSPSPVEIVPLFQ